MLTLVINPLLLMILPIIVLLVSVFVILYFWHSNESITETIIVSIILVLIFGTIFNYYKNKGNIAEQEVRDVVVQIVLDREEQFSNKDYTMNELLYELENHEELSKYSRFALNEIFQKHIKKTVFDNYERKNPLYQELLNIEEDL